VALPFERARLGRGAGSGAVPSTGAVSGRTRFVLGAVIVVLTSLMGFELRLVAVSIGKNLADGDSRVVLSRFSISLRRTRIDYSLLMSLLVPPAAGM
jgi:hypothetical protein